MKKFLVVFAPLLMFFWPPFAVGQFYGEINLASAPVIFVGENADDQAGYHISIAGDVNHDGVDDILIAAPNNSEAGDTKGQVYLIFGKSDNWNPLIDLRDADASFFGEVKSDRASHDVFGLGDINNDGIDDFAIGVKFVDQAAVNAGKTYIFFGKETGWNQDTPLTEADASFLGEEAGSEAGHVSPAGDLNGDGINDLIIGAGFNDQAAANAGKVYIVFGKADGWEKDLSLTQADASFLGEAAEDFAGHRLSNAGDVNGDGLDDILIGAHGADADSLKNRGKVYVIFGKASGWEQAVSLANADASFVGTEATNFSLGWNVCSAGDVNADGFNDMLIASQNRSKVFLINGKATDWEKSVVVDEAAEAIFAGENSLDHAGYDMRAAGDLNSDGRADFIIGAYGNDQNGADAGKSYVFYGRMNWPKNVGLADADATFLGEAAGDQSGFSVAGGGDVNGDGLADILIAANLNDASYADAGKVYLLFGSRGDLTVVQPNGGEVWNVGEQYKITWHSANPQGTIKIELSRDGGSTWEFLKETEDDGAAYWDITGSPSDSCVIKVTNLTTSLSDESDAIFSIVNPSLTLGLPNGGEKWFTGEDHSIVWQSVGDLPKIKIELSTNNGIDWVTVADSTDNTGVFVWTIPNTFSAQCLIRIQDSKDGSPVDVSDSVFEIAAPPNISALVPNGGESWQIGTEQNITWSSTNTSGAVNIELSRDNGSSWEELVASTSDEGSWQWNVIGPSSANCLIRVADADGDPADVSDSTFAISDIPDIAITSPTSGDSWMIGTSQQISWTSLNTSGHVRVRLSRDQFASWETLADSLSDEGLFSWIVTEPASNSCVIEISDLDGTPADTSEFFAVTDIPQITVLSPNGGENWQIASQQTISWSSTNGGPNVQIEISRNSGVDWEVLADSTENDGSWQWAVTGPSSQSCLLRLNAKNGSASDTSDATFTISEVPTIAVTSPNGAESWEIGSDQQITWTSVNITSAVEISLSWNNGLVWFVVEDSTENDGNWSWKVTGPVSDSCLVRISAVDGSVTDISDAPFAVFDGLVISLTSPNGGELWEIGGQREISWSVSKFLGMAIISLSRDHGKSWEVLKNLEEVAQGSQSWIWPVTGPAADSCLIKISDGQGKHWDNSDATFSIHYQVGVVLDAESAPTSFALLQNYPNPFNPETKITYQVPEKISVQLAVFNLSGHLVRNLADESRDAGTYSLVWDGRDQLGRSLPSGFYFCRMTAGEYQKTVRMLYLK